ncbi:multiple sugar transport system substrate-binding protein [Thermocatellispora tengchongensis]|uniref:Multiple sugar transport system substrate-binding protein n=1 Tax=Thermocatellispora tengchongensis TaxID=1073253 RepID=A0A840PMI6_9ACTN|nr:ABC transporter substrate-binding protein [Thermocatellispora tengchongensis]MBB5139001.1 multiple sugar transport system substrate-binding protein [Thermocatellispora tengchongensis]
MRRRLAPLAAAGIAVLALAACTAGTEDAPRLGAKPSGAASALPAATIELWHGFSADHEVKAFEDAVAGFRKKFPQITVKLVKAVEDDKIIQAVRAGQPPDVASSFSTDNVAQFCKTGMFQDLNPVIAQDGVDIGVLPQVVQNYTQFEGKRCVMPLLADAYGLYYNKKLMKGHEPPKTLSELTRLAKELTVRDSEGNIEVAGFMPSTQYYEHSISHLGTMVGGKWYNPDGTSAIGSDPAWKQLLTWQKELIDWYGHDKLEKFRKGLGQEWSADNPFHVGKVAMAIDGEWRNAMIALDAKDLDYGTAPVPVADDKPQLYGGGFISGTIIGIPRGAKNPQAAWELVKYLTTDTDGLVTLSNALRNVPTTKASLASPALKKDANFQTALDVFAHPASFSLPAHINSVYNQEAFAEFVVKWESGAVTDLDAGLAEVDKTINDKLKLAGG